MSWIPVEKKISLKRRKTLRCLPLLCIRRKFGKEDGGRAMYLETYSMKELMELIEEKGYCSVEAVEILKEMEQAKKGYDFLLRDCEKKAWKTDQVVVDYYRHLLEELRKALPYDAMGGQHTIPILVLQEFRKPDIVEKIRDFIGCQAGFSDHALLQEIQKFMTVHLDPQGIILYMDVLGKQPAARNVYKQGGQIW